MKIAGIVAEFNPFHNGHALLIERLRARDGDCRATHIVTVMSGNFTQRGEAALLPKRDRATMALAGGADLVIELPLPYALSSAEGFAHGAISLLHGMGCVDTLAFGSECGDLAALQRAADAMETEAFRTALRYALTQGISFAQASQQALAQVTNPAVAKLLEGPNNMLGVEYLRAVRRLGAAMTPCTVQRVGPIHDAPAPVGILASAGYLRRVLSTGRIQNALPYLPADCIPLLEQAVQEGRAPAEEARLDKAILAKLRTMSAEQLAALPGVSEGIENRLAAAIRQAGTMEELLEKIKTRRYPLTRIRRLLWSAFLDIPAGADREAPPYLHILGANEHGREILAAAARTATVPQITRAGKVDTLGDRAQQWFALESKADDLYALCLPKPLPCGTLYTEARIRL